MRQTILAGFLIMALGLVGCNASDGGSGGADTTSVEAISTDDSVSVCFDQVIFDRNECWQNAAYIFTDYNKEFHYFFTELRKRDGDSFFGCFDIQNEFADCVGATDEQANNCRDDGDLTKQVCLVPAQVDRYECYVAVFNDPAVVACNDRAAHAYSNEDCGYVGRKACDKAFEIEEEACLNDADYAEQDCLTGGEL